jgi:hypothetical protein
MSSHNLPGSGFKSVQDQQMAEKILALFQSGNEFTLQRLIELVGMDEATLSLILAHLVKAGRLQQVFRIESSAGGGIDDFHSFGEIPRSIMDWRTGRNVPVTTDNLRVIYEPAGKNA